MARRKVEPKLPVEQDRALEHAILTFRRAWASSITGFKSWGNVELDSDPLVIHDINGEPLFYEFNAMDGNQQIGRIKASATMRVGATIPTVEFGQRPWDPDSGTEAAKKKAMEMYPKARIENTELVCYSYPKIGVRVDMTDEEVGDKSLIFDVADTSHISRYGADELEGQTAWSYLDELDPYEEQRRTRLWEMRDKDREASHQKTPKLFARGFTAQEAEKVQSTFVLRSDLMIIPFFSSKLLKFAPRCASHECFELYAQHTNVYCAVATGQMILDYYRYFYDQDDIATAMGTGASGTSNSGQVNGYESLSNNCLNATYDTTADWSEARSEINANRPVKSGVPGHARACAGWKRQNIWIIGQPPKRWLRIYDPWPWNSDICNGGQEYWEDWDAITHTNFIYVRHRATACS
jgi:hypothetical protein